MGHRANSLLGNPAVEWLRAQVGRIDPLAPVVGGVALFVYALHGLDGSLSRDLGVYSYAGQQVADGVPPYEGILNRAGPLAHLIPAIGVGAARIGGVDDLVGMRVLFLLIAVASVCVVYLFARDLFRSWFAGLSAATAFLAFAGLIEYASNGPREKTPMVLFLLLSLWAGHRHRWFTAGVFLSLATLVLQIAFPVGISAIIVMIVGAPRTERVAALVRFAVGGLVPLALCLVYFLLVGALQDFIEAFFLINAQYTSANPMSDNFAQAWTDLQEGYGASLWVVIVGIVAIIALSVPALRRDYRRQHPEAVAIAALGVATIIGLIWTYREFDDWPDAMLLLPTAAFGIGGLAREVTRRLPQRWARAATLAWVMSAVVMATSFSVGEANPTLPGQRASVAAALRPLPSDATMMSINAPQAMVLAGKTNPIRHQMFNSGLNQYIQKSEPDGLEGIGELIAEERPTLIALRGKVRSWFADPLRQHYVKMGRAPGWEWYVDESVGPDVVSKLRRANREARRNTVGPISDDENAAGRLGGEEHQWTSAMGH